MPDAVPTPAGKVERHFLQRAALPFLTRAEERVPVITVANYVELGQLTALRFLEWLQENPEGVAALPTGKTPEYFIRWTRYYLEHWDAEAGEGLIKAIGLAAGGRPSCKRAHFVQLDEFFPMDPAHERSFRHYVKKYYIDGFGFDEGRALLLDAFHLPSTGPLSRAGNLELLFGDGRFAHLDLRERQPQGPAEALRKEVIGHFDRVCEEHERRIRDLGGIGFFLGGIGPDGHVAFNVRGSSHHSATRLTAMNYETMAAAAQDLGGIEQARQKAVITIGLETITYNKDAVAVIMAAGEAKAKVVAQAVEEPADIGNPASCLQSLANARFYLTQGAASRLRARRVLGIREKGSIGEVEARKLVIDGALARGMDLKSLGKGAAPGSTADRIPGPHHLARTLPDLAAAKTGKPLPVLAQEAADDLARKIRRGLRLSALGSQGEERRFLHTAPHHDDIELAYFPLLHHLVRYERNVNHFAYLTSGFTSVTNHHVLERLEDLRACLRDGSLWNAMDIADLEKEETRYREITGYLNAIAGQDRSGQALFTAARLFRHFRRTPGGASASRVLAAVEEQIGSVKALVPGMREPETLQALKGRLREWEAELVWAHFGLGPEHVSHLRLEFYTGSIFPQDPEYERDVLPIVALLEKVRPNVVTLALDPEGSGPDTHFKVLTALAAALETYAARHGADDLRVWGYRNVWSRFHPADADAIVPVSLNSFAVLHSMFDSCFVSQKSASFPSPDFDGAFSRLCQRVWVEQMQDLTALLGRETFYGHAHPMMKRAFGAIYLKDMSYAEFVEVMKPHRELMESKARVRFDLG
jgi:glucosamine-6-phosphate deaminase